MPKARYKQVVDEFATKIRSGELRSGDRLPTHRKLAEDYRLALATASRVYAELETMGLVIGETGRGTFVRETSLPPGLGIDQPAVAEGVVDLNFNYPSLPGQGDILRTALRQLALSGDLNALLRYQPHGGRTHEREIIAQHLTTRGVNVNAPNLLIVDGAQHGLATTVMALLKPGDILATDSVTYPGMKVLADSFRLELAPIRSDVAGPDLHELEQLCLRRKVRAVYVQPTVHNPLGWVMSTEKRQKLVSLARKRNLILIEDAAYAFLETHSPPPVFALAPERTVYVSGFSKSVATGLRVGFVTAPTDWIPLIERAIRATTWNTPGVMTAIVCGWIEDGTVARLELEKRKDAMQRQAIVSDVLRELNCVGHAASYFTWITLSEEARADKIVRDLLNQNISVSSAEAFSTAAQIPHAIRIALGSVNLDVLQQALMTIRSVVDQHTYG